MTDDSKNQKRNPSTGDFDWRLFFRGPAGVAQSLFGGRLSQRQVDGCNRVLHFGFNEYDLPMAHVAYILATAYHETGKAMHPVKETQKRTEALPPSDEVVIRRLDWAFDHGRLTWVKTPYWRNGYFGRGEVQLTHLSNYRRMNKVVKAKFPLVDIVKEPNSIIEKPEVSTVIMVEGMVRGMFTGKKLSSHGLGDPFFDHNGARDIINPKEYGSYATVGEYSISFLRALERSKR